MYGLRVRKFRSAIKVRVSTRISRACRAWDGFVRAVRALEFDVGIGGSARF